MGMFTIVKDEQTMQTCVNTIAKLFQKRGVLRVDYSEAKGRTNPRLRTLFMWHGQVASQINIMNGSKWKPEDIHEVLFKPRWMPYIELVTPSGRIIRRPMGTSDKRSPVEGDDRSPRRIISEAMTQYLVWICENGFEVTVPEEKEWKQWER